MEIYETRKRELREHRKRWLITGVAGFIGSHLLEALLKLDQQVIGFDNLMTGKERNLQEVRAIVTDSQWQRFSFLPGDITDFDQCQHACEGVDYVLHHAAFVSVPDSIADPLHAHRVNSTGFINVLEASHKVGVSRFIYASSSAVYGDDPAVVKIESTTGRPLSPYAAAKRSNELYAEAFTHCYDFDTVGLRYFNIFGERQNPDGPYAAVIPNWIRRMIQGKPIPINGDGQTTRDFCYVADVVQANILAATCMKSLQAQRSFNIACGTRTTLNELFEILRALLLPFHPHLEILEPAFQDFRHGDIRHSQANIEAAREILGYSPRYSLKDGLDTALTWFRKELSAIRSKASSSLSSVSDSSEEAA